MDAQEAKNLQAKVARSLSLWKAPGLNKELRLSGCFKESSRK